MRKKVLFLLGLYIDFIFAGSLVTLASFALGTTVESLGLSGPSFIVETGASVLVVALGRLLGLSLGTRLLAYANEQVDAGSPRWLWPNLVLGTFLMLEGLKEMVRWSQVEATMPVFGLLETTPLKITALLAVGTMDVVAGGLLVAFAPVAKQVAAAALAVSIASVAASWPVLPEAIERVAIARRALQGRPIREGEIELMQAGMPYLAAGSLIILIVLLYLCRTRESPP